MKEFHYKGNYENLLTPDIVALLSQIHEFKGKQILYAETRPEVLSRLAEAAKIQSTEASNRIEGIVAADARLQQIVRDKTLPKTASEKKIAGYRDVLATVLESYEYIPPSPSMILQLHRNLCKFSGNSAGGSYRSGDGTTPDGSSPVPARETPGTMERLCREANEALGDGEVDPLVIIPMFVLDFLRIRPFNDGNGRMSRLLALLLLCRAGYTVGKYISVEKLIADSGETYFDAIAESSDGWYEGRNDYAPFVRYMLTVIVAAYRDFSRKADPVTEPKLSKADRVKKTVKEHAGRISKAGIAKLCPDISEITIERALADLLKDGSIVKIRNGRYTEYAWKTGN